MRAYQHAFPAEVAGLIFSNSSNRVGRLVGAKPFLIWDLTEGAIRSTFSLPTSDKGRAPAREGEPFDRLPPTLRTVRLWLDVRLMGRVGSNQSNMRINSVLAKRNF